MRWWSEQLTWLLLALLSAKAIAKKDGPAIETTDFDALITNIFYFDDSDVVLFSDLETGKVWRSEDAGVAWSVLEDVQEALEVIKHPVDPKVAVVAGLDTTHWITKDRGKTWESFSVPNLLKFTGRPIAFHGEDSKRMLVHAANCLTMFDCTFPVYYTTDGFATEPTLLIEDANSCLWAKSTPQFETGDPDLNSDRILCNVKGEFSFFEADSRVVMSDDFFTTNGDAPILDEDGRPVDGIINIASVTGYLVAAAKSIASVELALYVTDDTVTWHRAEFGEHRVEEDAYTLLESTNYSMQVDVMSSSISPMGALFTSNSNGTFFTLNIDHTNRNSDGYVDFEKIQDIPGIVIVNQVTNWKEVESSFMAEKEIVTRISFDDGRTWEPLIYEKGELHLHSVTDQENSGRIFSSPAPGIVMGVGNKGKYLKAREVCDTFISDDAGLTWSLALKGPHFYEMGDQGALLVAVEDGPTDEVKWSIDHGKTWETKDLKQKITTLALTTTPDSTSLKFLLLAQPTKGGELDAEQVIALDFSDLHERKCSKGDFEDWYARVDEEGKPTCLMGHTHMFRRRKADAKCFVDDEFNDPEPLLKDCACTEQDYECDFNFVKDKDGKCTPAGPLRAPKGACDADEDTYLGSSGYRLIPGNTCTQRDGVVKDEPIDRKCKDTTSRPPSGEINATLTTFPRESQFEQRFYLERCEKCKGDDETIVARTDNNIVYITHDHGKEWNRLDVKEDITAIYPHQYFQDQVFFITAKKKVYYSKDRGQSIHHFNTPEPPNAGVAPALSFHPKQSEWLIWVGDKEGQTIAQVSKKHGDDWKTLLRSVRRCEFIYREGRLNSTNLVYCEQHESENTDEQINLVSSQDWFDTDRQTMKEDVINFATMAEFIMVAVRAEDKESLKVDASVDGQTFADAHFPKNFQVPHQHAYTVLDSSTHAVFLHVTVNNITGSEYGAIVKSNSNGTSYVLSISDVNRNHDGYVDFEKVRGLEGISVVNIVANANEVDDGAKKKLKTIITHNDGAEWALIARPEMSGEFKKSWCSGDIESCSLHLLGYTERDDPGRMYSSPTALALLVANGNVGEFLGDDEPDTFMSSDGGIEWHMIEEGTWAWAFGDQGSIVVIVKKGEPVRELKYSLDEGKTWETYSFSEDDMLVTDISTVPSDTSRNIILWGKVGKSLATINVDFSGLKERSKKCLLDEKNPESDLDDYLLWSPRHPLSDSDCLFGHVAQYHRKITDRPCYNGQRLPVLHTIARNCSCTRQDFECDYNFERASDGNCKLVPGLEALNPEAVCWEDPDREEYYGITGYRRIPLTTCEGGRDLEYTSRTKPCPNHEDEYRNRHSISAAGLFFAVVLPIAAACGIGWWVWRNWDGKFGRIQLGDGAAGSRIGLGGAFERDAPWIKYPVLALSGVIAVVAAIPMVVGTLWRTVRTRFGGTSSRYGSYGSAGRPYTTRSSFQRGRGNYAVVDPDEGELLGDESEDEA